MVFSRHRQLGKLSVLNRHTTDIERKITTRSCKLNNKHIAVPVLGQLVSISVNFVTGAAERSQDCI
jgi:hypothetical protein